MNGPRNRTDELFVDLDLEQLERDMAIDLPDGAADDYQRGYFEDEDDEDNDFFDPDYPL